MEVHNKVVFILIFISNFFNATHESEVEVHSRKARHLVYPDNGSKVQLIVGIGLPIQLPFQAVTLGYTFKSIFYTPTNGTMYTKPFEAFADVTGSRQASDEERKRREADVPTNRWDFYAVLETIAHRSLSIGRAVESVSSDVGRQCVLRAICESAVSGLQHDGLLGEVLHLILTPSTTSEPLTSKHHIDYHVAERIGRSAESLNTCGALFSACHSGALDLITRLVPMF